MVWFLGYFISKFEIRQIDRSRKSSVKRSTDPLNSKRRVNFD